MPERWPPLRARGRPVAATCRKGKDSRVPVIRVRFPAAVLAGLDRMAAEKGISRNRLVVESCRRAVGETPPPEVEVTRPPDEFYTHDHLSPADLRLLRRSRGEMDRAIKNSRRSRTRPPF